MTSDQIATLILLLGALVSVGLVLYEVFVKGEEFTGGTGWHVVWPECMECGATVIPGEEHECVSTAQRESDGEKEGQ